MDDDAALLARSHTDPAAFGTFYRRHGEALLTFLVRRAGDAEAGADLTAETFAAALRDAPRFDPGRGDAVGWLYGIAHHKLADYHRRGAVERRAQRRLGMRRVGMDDEALEQVERLASLEVDAQVLAGALDTLPSDQRDAVLARVVGGRSYAEIGARADVSPVLARQRVSRGLRTLRHRLGGGSG